MARYDKCPTCGNLEKDTKLYICKKCSHIGCCKVKGYIFTELSGCWCNSACPKCGQTGNKTLGYIE